MTDDRPAANESRPETATPVLLSGGNPQIAKADGDAPGAGVHRGDAGLKAGCRTPARRARRPHRAQRAQGGEVELTFYGVEDKGWFLSFHCFTNTSR